MRWWRGVAGCNRLRSGEKAFANSRPSGGVRERSDMQKVLIGVLAVTTLALAVLCSVQTKRLRAIKEEARAVEEGRAAEAETHQAQAERVKELERANRRLDEQVQKFAAVTTQLRTNEARQSSNLTALAERMRNAQSGGASGEEQEGIFGKGMGEMLGKMMKDPAMREMMREQQKAMINMMYAGLFKDLNLSPDEKEKLKGILTETQMRNMESAQSLFGGKQEGAADDSEKQMADAKQQTDAEIKALLGDERFAQYEEYQKSMGERMQIDQLKTQLAAEEMPLQDQQMAQLLQAMKEEKTRLPPAIPTDQTQMPKKEMFTAENLEKQMKWLDDYNQRVGDRAAQILTPEQLTKYRAFQEQQTSMQKLGLNMAKQMFGSEKSGGPTVVPAPLK
jgi:hypothetical protein